MSRRQKAGALLSLAALGLGLSLDSPALGLILFALFSWTTEPVPVELSAFLVLLLLPACGLLSFQESFAPFSGSTVWLIFAGMVLGLVLTATGLGDHLAGFGLRRLGRSPARLLFHLHLLGLAAAFLVPSGVVRVLLLIPIGMAVVDGLGGQKDRTLNAAVLLSLLCSTYYGGAGVMTGAVPNLVVAGQLERESGRVLYWAEWLQWMFPVMGLLRTALCWGVIYLLFGRRLPRVLEPGALPAAQPLEPRQRRALAILLLGVGLWAADSLHHIPPVYVGLILVVLCTLPGWGPLQFSQLRQVNFPFLFYIAALFSLGTALEKSGIDRGFVAGISGLLDLDGQGFPGQYLAITYMTVPLNFLMDNAAVAGVLTPAMIELGRAHLLEAVPSALSVAMAAGLVFLPYQSAPFMTAYSFRRLGMGQMVACMVCISLLTLFLLCPLNVLYWDWIGLL